MGNPFRRTSSSTPKPLSSPIDPTPAESQSSTNSNVPGGLLPTTKVDVATASKPQSAYFNGMAGSHLYSSQLAGHHSSRRPPITDTKDENLLIPNLPDDASYYENWNRERQEAIARGEDPNAKFLALVAEREARSKKAKLRRFFSSKKSHGQGLTANEEREALERDEAAKAARSVDDGVVR